MSKENPFKQNKNKAQDGIMSTNLNFAVEHIRAAKEAIGPLRVFENNPEVATEAFLLGCSYGTTIYSAILRGIAAELEKKPDAEVPNYEEIGKDAYNDAGLMTMAARLVQEHGIEDTVDEKFVFKLYEEAQKDAQKG